MRRLTAALCVGVLAVGTASACDDHHGTCEVEDWRYWHVAVARMLGIEGVATCDTGAIRARIYQGPEGDQKFIGVAEGLIEGHTFTLTAFAVHEKPAELSLKTSIDPEG